VIAGPAEATAVGNVMIQAISKNVLSSLEQSRKVVSRSFPLKNYEPEDQEKWEDIYGRVKGMFS
jgi:rhamnulokinase